MAVWPHAQSRFGVDMAHSPRIDKVEVVARGLVRRSKLYFLRELEGKAARLKDVRDRAQ